MDSNVYIPKREYKVLVRCYTYNHSIYIEDALNGFAMQQTDFPFVCLVVDDCSTDGEQNVIKEWMSRECDMQCSEIYEDNTAYMVLIPHKTNSNCDFAFYFLKENLHKQKDRKRAYVEPWRKKCEYEAMCEGDDYWIVRDKLLRQIHYMDSNPNCLLSFTDVNNKNEKNGKIIRSFLHSGIPHVPKNFEDHLINNGYMAPCTWVYRISCLKFYEKMSHVDGTFAMSLDIFANGDVYFEDSVTSVYRSLPESASHFRNKKKLYNYVKGVFKTKCIYIERYKVSEDIIRIVKERYYSQALPYILLFEDLEDSKRDAILYSKNICPKSLKLKITLLLSKSKYTRLLLNLIYNILWYYKN